MTPPPPSVAPPVDADARELIRMSRRIGRDPSLVQAGGGNTSVKSSDGLTMYVKASGTALADMAPGRGYRRVRLAEVVQMLRDSSLMRAPAAERERRVLDRLRRSTVDDLEGRPSVETALHGFLGRAVAHTHPAVANGLCCVPLRRGTELARRWFSHLAGEPLFLPFVDPGLPVARSAFRAARRYLAQRGTPPALIFLGNHGLFVSAETGPRALALTRLVERTTRAQWRRLRGRNSGEHALPPGGASASCRRKIAAAMGRVWRQASCGRKVVVRFSADAEVAAALAHPEIERLMRIGPLTPDHVVYAHGQPVWLGPPAGRGDVEGLLAEALARARSRLPRVPLALLASGVGLFVAGADARSAASAMSITRASLVTLLVACALGGCRGLTRRAIDYIENWEVEEFRRRVARGR